MSSDMHQKQMLIVFQRLKFKDYKLCECSCVSSFYFSSVFIFIFPPLQKQQQHVSFLCVLDLFGGNSTTNDPFANHSKSADLFSSKNDPVPTSNTDGGASNLWGDAFFSSSTSSSKSKGRLFTRRSQGVWWFRGCREMSFCSQVTQLWRTVGEGVESYRQCGNRNSSDLIIIYLLIWSL